MTQIVQPNCCVLLIAYHRVFGHLPVLEVVILYQCLLFFFFSLFYFTYFPIFYFVAFLVQASVSSHGELVQVIDLAEKLHKLLGFEGKVLTRLFF